LTDLQLWQRFSAHVTDQHEHDQRDRREPQQRRGLEGERMVNPPFGLADANGKLRRSRRVFRLTTLPKCGSRDDIRLGDGLLPVIGAASWCGSAP
jgi:hypothetical protein